MKKLKNFIFLIISFLIMTPPFLVNAQYGPAGPVVDDTKGLVPCGRLNPWSIGSAPCDLNGLFQLGNNILTWLIWAAVPAATIAIAYAGWLYIWGGSVSEGKRSEAKKILQSTLIGLAAVLGAALIIKAILQFLATQDYQNIIGN